MPHTTHSTNSTTGAGKDAPRYLKAIEVADLLRTSVKAIYVMIERQQLPGVVRIGRRVLVRTESLISWLDRQGAKSLQGDQR
jgi:excisionase family DNA binding protein